jgi:hypothetical protein
MRQRLHTRGQHPKEEQEMKRFHVHVSVPDVGASIAFYEKVFGMAAAIVKPDYAKWMLDDPRVNFAISSGRAAGLNHLGFQVETDAELKGMRDQLEGADRALIEEVGANCCYAVSDKYWITDPAGIAWETFRSLGTVPIYGDNHAPEVGGVCCTPAPAPQATKACCV